MLTDSPPPSPDNAPFKLRPDNYKGEKAILLVHGLFETPFAMRDIGHYFFQQGFLVRAILLPGHGTRPEELLSTSYQDWIEATRVALDVLKKEARTVYFLGFSTGATLGIYHALQGAPIEKLILIAPALKLRSWIRLSAYFSNWVFKCFRKTLWVRSQKQLSDVKYTSYPTKIGQEVNLLADAVRTSEASLTVPTLMILSGQDETIDVNAAVDFFKDKAPARSEGLYYTNRPKPLEDPRINILSSEFPDQKILSFSHICLCVDPHNPYYLEKNTANAYKGSLQQAYKKPGFQRLTYNPDFANMMKRVLEFL